MKVTEQYLLWSEFAKMWLNVYRTEDNSLYYTAASLPGELIDFDEDALSRLIKETKQQLLKRKEY